MPTRRITVVAVAVLAIWSLLAGMAIGVTYRHEKQQLVEVCELSASHYDAGTLGPTSIKCEPSARIAPPDLS